MTKKTVLSAVLGTLFGIGVYQTVDSADACSCNPPTYVLALKVESVNGNGATPDDLEQMKTAFSGVTFLRGNYYNTDSVCMTKGGSQ
jgi:hypothetical protein